MNFTFENRLSESPFVQFVWRTQSEYAGSFTSAAESRWEMVLWRYQGETGLTVRGPETQATTALCPPDAEFFGIVFNVGTYLSPLPGSTLINGDVHLPEARSQSFWFQGAAWQFPNFENADTFVNRLVRQGLLLRDPVVEDVLQGRPHDYSIRTVRRRFLHATGMTHKTIQQIQRAKQAAALLEQGVPILDVVYEAGYFDQPHMTKALKYFLGQTPAQLSKLRT
jgi:AraC-like DNA-binding protein